MKRSESTKEIATALCAAQSQLGNAVKGNTNPAFKSRYADLTAYIDASRGALAANGLALSQGVATEGQKVTVTSLLLHKSGEWLESDLSLQAMKPDPQGIGSAISYGRRYALAALLNMGADDDDGNMSSQSSGTHDVRPKQEEQPARPKDLPPNNAPPVITKTSSVAPPPATQNSQAPASTTGNAQATKITDEDLAAAYKEVADLSQLSYAKFLWNDVKDKTERYECLSDIARCLDEIDRRLGTGPASKLIAAIFAKHKWDASKPTSEAARAIYANLQDTIETGEVAP